MKRIEATLAHEQLEQVKNQLVQRMTISEVQGFSQQQSRKATYRGADYLVDFLPKVRLEVVVPNQSVGSVVDTIVRAGHLRSAEEGGVYVTHVDDLWQVCSEQPDFDGR